MTIVNFNHIVESSARSDFKPVHYYKMLVDMPLYRCWATVETEKDTFKNRKKAFDWLCKNITEKIKLAHDPLLKMYDAAR